MMNGPKKVENHWIKVKPRTLCSKRCEQRIQVQRVFKFEFRKCPAPSTYCVRKAQTRSSVSKTPAIPKIFAQRSQQVLLLAVLQLADEPKNRNVTNGFGRSKYLGRKQSLGKGKYFEELVVFSLLKTRCFGTPTRASQSRASP